MATKRAPRKRITRGKSVRLPNGGGSIIITRAGEVLFKKAPKKKAAPKRKNPTKAKQPARRVLKAMATWVRSQAPAKKKRTPRRATSRRTSSRKGGRP